MALQIKHKIVPNNSNRNVVFTETTGVYSSTNPTGYGATQIPTPYRETTDIVGLMYGSSLQILTVNGTFTFNGGITPTVIGSIYSVIYNNATAQSIAAGTTQTFDLGTLIPSTYIDGIYKSVYYNWFPGYYTVASNTTNSVTVSQPTEFINAKYINIYYSGGAHYIFEILSLDTTTGVMVLNGTVPLLVPADYDISYESITYFANTYSINKCLHSRISKLAISSCTCNNGCTEKLYEAVMLYMAIQPNMDLGKYQKAQDIIEYLTNYCNDGCCNC